MATTDNKNLWPSGKTFAFSVFDDTDCATVENVAPIYAFLADCGFQTTKSVWPLRGDLRRGKHAGQTLEDDPYRQWLLKIQSQGFEIGFHGATWHSATREQMIEALSRFAEVFGHSPRLATNHTQAADALYWGDSRLTGWRRAIYNLLTLGCNRGVFRGHLENDPCFWGDVCREKIDYLRNFTFRGINTLKRCPWMPYHDPLKPYVKYWFASSDGHDVPTFNRCLSEKHQDRLEAEGGLCIMYTHFARNFCDQGKVNPRFRELMTRLSKKNGWFAPTSVLLDRLLAVNGPHDITAVQRRQLEMRWLSEKVFTGSS